jgi:hypothetical protein
MVKYIYQSIQFLRMPLLVTLRGNCVCREQEPLERETEISDQEVAHVRYYYYETLPWLLS